MTYSKGGRGKQAPYETKIVRVPEPITPIVEVFKKVFLNVLNQYGIDQANYLASELSKRWLNHYQETFNEEDYKPVTSKEGLSKEQAIEEAKKILRSKKGNKKQQFTKLLQVIYGGDVSLD